MKTRVVHVNDNVPGAVYIGRANGRKRLKASPFANPFRIGDPHPWPERGTMTRGDVMVFYVEHFWSHPELIRALPELRDRPLACWCRRDGVPMTTGEDGTTDNRCHGDLLSRYLDLWTDDELRAKADELESEAAND